MRAVVIDGRETTALLGRADALALFAETWLSHCYQLLSGGDRQQVVVHVDSETLKDSTPGRCEI